MLTNVVNLAMYGAIFLSLFLVDYVLGNGFVDVFQKIFCKIACFIKKSVKEEVKQVVENAGVVGNPISLPILFTEIVILTLTIAFLKKYKQDRGKDRFDELLQESKEALRQTNEFLEKWRTRRINWQAPTEYSYLDDEPQEIKPLQLEVPILHMAIIDTRGTSRSQSERGDASDAMNMNHSTLVSVTSLMDEDFESIAEPVSEQRLDVEDVSSIKNVEFENQNRYLWDVAEEDSMIMDD